MRTDSDSVEGVFMDDENASYDSNSKKFLSERVLLTSVLKNLVTAGFTL